MDCAISAFFPIPVTIPNFTNGARIARPTTQAQRAPQKSAQLAVFTTKTAGNGRNGQASQKGRFTLSRCTRKSYGSGLKARRNRHGNDSPAKDETFSPLSAPKINIYK